MNILIAPNSMKGSLNAFVFADIMEEAFHRSGDCFSIRKVPVADGGDFTGEVLRQSLDAVKIPVRVKGPLGKPVNSAFYKKEGVAVIEMADASGMKLLHSEELDPLRASSYGTGELVAAALSEGCSTILLAVGGSATVDGGAGMMEALGFSFYDDRNRKIPGNGENLSRISRIVKNIPQVIPEINIITDVNNPLLGPNGAATVFGPQKGASSETVSLLEKGLKHWAEILEAECGKELAGLSGAGAAGGIAVPLMAFMNARIVPGAEFVLSMLNFEKHVRWADIVITGEGSVDKQTLADKAPYAVAKMARSLGKPVFAFGGKVEKEASPAFDGLFSICQGPVTTDQAINNAGDLLNRVTAEFAKTLQALMALPIKDRSDTPQPDKK